MKTRLFKNFISLTAFLLVILSVKSNAQTCQAGFTYVMNPNGEFIFLDSSWSAQPIVQYEWDFGDGITMLSGDSVPHAYQQTGTYQVCLSITTMDSCTNTACQLITVQVNNPCNLVLNFLIYNQNGQDYITPDVAGGTPPFTYSWNSGETTPTILAVPGTNQCLTVTDSNGCSTYACYNPSSGCNLTGTIYEDTFLQMLVANPIGGTPPYLYYWNTGDSTSSISPTGPGVYTVNIIDVNGCIASLTYSYMTGCNYIYSYTQIGPGVYQFVSNAPNSGGFTLWQFGDGSSPDTSTSNVIIHTFIAPGTYNVCMTYDSCASYCGMVVVGNAASNGSICGTVFEDSNGNSIIDSGENGIPFAYLMITGNNYQTTIVTDSSGSYSLVVPAGSYTLTMCNYGNPGTNNNGIFTVPVDTNSNTNGCAYYTFTVAGNDTVCGMNFGIFLNASTVSGVLFYDADNNGVFDANESGIPYQLIQVGSYSTYTDSYGAYNILLPVGTYTVSYTPTGFYSTGTITTGTTIVDVTQNGVVYANNNVGLYLPPGSVDISVSIYPSTTVTPGFGAWYYIGVCNEGNTPVAAEVTMQYDPILTPDYQSPTANNVNTTTHTLTWTTPIISPFSCYYIWVTFNAQQNAVLGSNTLESVFVSPSSGIDINLNNNMDTIHQVVVGSWDPNAKLSVKTNSNNPNLQLVSSINQNQEIRYTIHFQNTGTAPAHNVVVLDNMSPKLDLMSYQFLSASHNCQIIRNGNTTTYKFMNIMLPDSTNNEPQSHGFISYKVNALSSLNVGEQITDNAEIYFDFNSAVITNDATVTMVAFTSLPSVMNNANSEVYPNPAKDYVNITIPATKEQNVSIRVFDTQGKQCMEQQETLKQGNNNFLIHTSLLNKGMYFIQTTTDDGQMKTTKLSIH